MNGNATDNILRLSHFRFLKFSEEAGGGCNGDANCNAVIDSFFGEDESDQNEKDGHQEDTVAVRADKSTFLTDGGFSLVSEDVAVFWDKLDFLDILGWDGKRGAEY